MPVASRAQVYHDTTGTLYTSGGLRAKDLKMNPQGNIVSKAASSAAKKRAAKPGSMIKAIKKARSELKKGSAADKKAASEMLVKGRLAARMREIMQK